MEKNIKSYAKLGIITLESCTDIGNKINEHIITKRMADSGNCLNDRGGKELSYIIPIDEIRFSNGEGKVRIEDTVRGKDIYILCDVSNYSCTYEMFGFTNCKGPDEHFQDIKRVLSAIGGKARRITVIMPLLYAARQHKRKGRESLDCAIALQELERLGVDEILTFDVHDPSIQNAIPLISFENLYPTYDIVKTFIENKNNLLIDKTNMIDNLNQDKSIAYLLDATEGIKHILRGDVL